MYLRSNSLSNSTDKTESNGKNDSNRLRNTQSCVSNNTLSFNLTSKGFNFGHLNIQGICGKQMTKFLELKAILTAPENRSLQVFGISESKLKDHKMSRCFNVVGFQKPFRKDNMSNGGGGIIVYVRNGLNVKRRIDLETNDISCIWLEILPQKGKSFLIGNMYRPPNSKIEFNDRFENFIDTVSQEGKEFILLGDFNKNLLPDHVDIEWENFTTSLGLSQLICDPTRVTETSNTLIDHIYTNAVENISKAHVCQTTISDHYAIFGSRKLNNCIKTNTHQTITYRSFKNFDENAFKADLQEVPWETVERFDNIDEAVDVWNSMFLEIVNKHAPMKSHRIKRKYQPEWLTPEILDCMKQRNKYKINGKMDEYKYTRNKVSSMIDEAKNEVYKNKIEEGKDDPRSIWKIFRQFGTSNKTNEKDDINIIADDNIISNDQDIANIFNEFFVNIAANLREPLKHSDFAELKHHIGSKLNRDICFDIPLTSCSFVCKYLSTLDVSKATGLDCIGPRLLTKAPQILAPGLTFIINKSLTTGKFPSLWKQAKVNPIFKAGSKQDVNNYRPISILPTLSKIIEKWVNKNLMKYLNQHDLLHQRQSGFRSCHSTETALIALADSWLRAINEGELVGCVLVDFRKAFDLVDHKLLLEKLRLYKLSNLCLSWFKSYLTNRSQQVVINGNSSKSDDVLYGVPQGSILGPLLFLMFINDLPLTLKHANISVDLYADDTTIHCNEKDKALLEMKLQRALDALKMWCLENGMIINLEKTHLMFIMSRQKRNTLTDNSLSLVLNGLNLQMTSNEKILGVHFDENLIWNNHFKHVSSKISSYLWLLYHIRSFLSVEHRLLFYNAYIKPHLEYCCVVWGNSSNYNIQLMEKLQRRACKNILGKDYSTLDDARNQLNMLSFEEMVFMNKAKLMYKIATNTAPIYLVDLFQMRINETSLENSQLNLRSVANKNMLIPKPRNNLFKSSISYSGALVWNSIPLDIKNSNTIESFTRRCLTWMKGDHDS